jgi:hypothetical protein
VTLTLGLLIKDAVDTVMTVMVSMLRVSRRLVVVTGLVDGHVSVTDLVDEAMLVGDAP